MAGDYNVEIPEPRIARFLFADTRMAWLWFLVRLYVGYEWLVSAWVKFGSASWLGDRAGTALAGFVNGSLQKTTGVHPDVSGWYAAFLQGVVLPHTVLFSYLVVYGEFLVGAALMVGAFTGIAAFFGAFMNINYLFAGTVSVNPFLLLLELFLILAWRNAGMWGIDRMLLPGLGVPWKPGTLLHEKNPPSNAATS